LKAKLLKKGDCIGVVGTSEPILGDAKEEIQNSIKLMEEIGLSVKIAKHIYNDPTRIWRNSKTQGRRLKRNV